MCTMARSPAAPWPMPCGCPIPRQPKSCPDDQSADARPTLMHVKAWAILAEAPAVKIMTTSRERLNLSEEWVLTMSGLSYPSSETEVMAVEQYSAVQFFV